MTIAPCDGTEWVRLALAVAHTDLALQQLTSLPWVGTPPSCVLRAHLETLFAAAGRDYRPSQKADSESALRTMVASGMGAGLLRLAAVVEAVRSAVREAWD